MSNIREIEIYLYTSELNSQSIGDCDVYEKGDFASDREHLYTKAKIIIEIPEKTIEISETTLKAAYDLAAGVKVPERNQFWVDFKTSLGFK